MAASTRRTARPYEVGEGLRRRFLARSAGDLVVLSAYPDGVSREELSFVAHRLAGAAGVFGFPALSQAAAELDAALAEQAPDVPARIARLAGALAALPTP